MKRIILVIILTLPMVIVNAQFYNPDFESWTADPHALSTIPTGWFDYTAEYYYQVTPGQNGNYALGMGVWYWYVKSRAFQHVPVNGRPSLMRGYYTYTDNNVYSLMGDTITDTAFVSIALTKWNNITMHSDTIGIGKTPLFASGSFSSFVCNINYITSDIPDSMIVQFDPSIVRRYEDITYWQALTSNGKCSYLTIDNLSLDFSNTLIPAMETETKLNIFPNPAADMLYFNVPSIQKGSFQVINPLGRIVLQGTLSQQTSQIDISTLDGGMYILEVFNNEKKVGNSKFLKN